MQRTHYCHRSTMSIWLPHSSKLSVKNLVPLTTQFSSLRFVLAAEHHTAKQYSKTGRTNPRKHRPKSNVSWNTRQNFIKILRLSEAALETVKSQLNVTPNMSRSWDSFITVPPIFSGGDWRFIGGDWEFIVRDLNTIIAFNIINQRSLHSLTFPRSGFKDSAALALTLTSGNGTTVIKWSYRHNRWACSPVWKYAPRLEAHHCVP